jgi:2'-5' RNA ligase
MTPDRSDETLSMSVVRPDDPVGTVTIGVAVAIPPPFAEELQRWRAEFGDPFAHAIPPHVTLLPPTPVLESRLDQVCEHLDLAAANHHPFEMTLRGTGSFRPVSPVVFVQVATGISECEQVEQQVRSGLLSRDLAFYYHPHVTVAHDLDDVALDHAFAELADYEASFSVDGFSMYRHGSDGVWRVEKAFGFDGGAGDSA